MLRLNEKAEHARYSDSLIKTTPEKVSCSIEEPS